MPDALLPIALDASSSPAPDPAAEPEGFLVAADDGTRIHFHDWGVPAGESREPGVVLVPGLLGPAWTWAPVARRLAGARRTVVADLRGHGLSDAPPGGFDLDTLAADVLVVAEGSGALDRGTVVLAGHGFGAIVAAGAAALLGERCAGLVLVDGGWERVEETTGVDVDEFLRGLDEPPGGHAVDGRLAGRPKGLRSRELGHGPGTGSAGRGRGDGGGAPAASGPPARGGGSGARHVRIRARRDAGPRHGPGHGARRARRPARPVRAWRSCGGRRRRERPPAGVRSGSPASRPTPTT